MSSASSLQQLIQKSIANKNEIKLQEKIRSTKHQRKTENKETN